MGRLARARHDCLFWEIAGGDLARDPIDLRGLNHSSDQPDRSRGAPEEHKAPFINSFLDAARNGSLAGMSVVFAGGIPGKYAELMLEDETGSSNNFLHIRPSGTEPLIRVYLETSSDLALSSLRDKINKSAAAI